MVSKVSCSSPYAVPVWMLWLAEQESISHVVGVELSNLAIQTFFKHDKVRASYKLSSSGNIPIHSSGKITIVEGNLFNCEDVLSSFQITQVYDRASLVAINWEDRDRYVDLMIRLMGASTAEQKRYFLAGIDYNAGEWFGPPHLINASSVKQLFDGKFSQIDHLERRDIGVKFSKGVQCYQDLWTMIL